jgi:Zn-dependent protease
MPFFSPIYIICILVAVAVHEWAHAIVARMLGDPTAEHAGRLTLNPLAHLDPIGALLFLVVGFGWANPVPINPLYFRRPIRDTALTALAGPVSNFILAFGAFLGLTLLAATLPSSRIDALIVGTGPVAMRLILQLLRASLVINLSLMAFNLLPIAPLDGSKIVAVLLPLRHQEAYMRFMERGPYILIALILFESLLPIRIISGWIDFWANLALTLFSSVL